VSLNPPEHRNSVVGGLFVLLARGVLLWIVGPLAACTWLVVGVRLRRDGVTFSQYLGWVDLNLIACLQRTIFRPLVRWPVSYVPPRQISTVTHRIRSRDPA
jgi:hypothetical protein